MQYLVKYNMFKWLKEWAKDYEEAEKCLRESGIFVISFPNGWYSSYIVNSNDDKLDPIQPNDSNSKVQR